MRLTIPTPQFRAAVTRAANTTSADNSLPVLSNLLLQASGSNLAISSTNLAQCSQIEVGCTVQQEGSTTLPAKKLADILGKVIGDDVSLEMDEHLGTLICGKSVFKLAGLSSADFPSTLFPESEVLGEWSFKSDELRNIFSQLAPSQSVDPGRYVLNGIYMKSGTTLDWVATDGRILSTIRTDNDGPKVSAILPADFVRHSIRALEGEDQVSIVIRTNAVKLIGESLSITSKLIEENYPNYKSITPESQPHSVELDRDDFLKLIDRLSGVGLDINKSHTVTLCGSKNNLEVAVNKGESNTASEDMAVKLSEPFRVRLNRKFIYAALRALPDDTVTMEYKDSFSPVIFKAGRFSSVIQVIRLKEGE